MGLGRLLRVLRKNSLLLTGSSLHQMIISGAQASKGSESSLLFWVMTDMTMIDRLKQFVESEMRSCSMDIGGITPLYVYRMWGGAVAIEDIATAMEEVRRMM